MVAMSSAKKDDKPSNKLSNGGPSEAIARLETAFLKDKVNNINNVVELISFILPGQATSSKAIHATRRVLKALENAPYDVLVDWLPARRAQYAEKLILIISEDDNHKVIEAAIAAAALTHRDVWQHVLRHAIDSTDPKVIELTDDFITRFDDLRCDALHIIAETGSIEARLRLLHISAKPSGNTAREEVSLSDLMKQLTVAWLSVLRLNLDADQIKDILRRLPTELIPNMKDPLRLADFLNACYNNSSDPSIACSAIDALYMLISKYSLDYPLFYEKLYALIRDETLFYTLGRERFLELTATFLLNSAFLPGAVVASFVKRLVRRALTAPTAGALWCLRLALDVLQKHPNLSYLVHRSVNLFDTKTMTGVEGATEPTRADPFDDNELDPQLSKAQDSSLWELETLKNHISPAVSRLVLAFSKDVRKRAPPPAGSLKDYAALEFEDIFQVEIKRKARSTHLAYYAPGEDPGLQEVTNEMGQFTSWT